MRYAFILALAFVGLFHCVGHAQAETTTERALRALCGPSAVYLAPHVQEAARTHLLHPVTLVAVMAKEAGCRMDLVGAHGERCAMQVHGVARNGHSNRELADPDTCIATGARWLSLREVECGGLFWGLSGYNAKTCRGSPGYARLVLATERRAWSEMRRKENREHDQAKAQGRTSEWREAMSYRYEDERPWLFTDEGQRCLLKVRDNAFKLCDTAGAFNGMKAFRDVHVGDTFKMMAILDRLVELQDIREITDNVWGQNRVFVKGDAP